MFANSYTGYLFAIPYLLLGLALIVIAVLLIVLLFALIRRIRVGTRLAEFQLEMALIDAGAPPTPPAPPATPPMPQQ